MNFLYDKLTGQVASYSESDIIFDKEKFFLKKVSIKKTDDDKLKRGWHPLIKNKKLTFIKPLHIERVDLKKEIENVKSLDKLKSIILNKLI